MTTEHVVAARGRDGQVRRYLVRCQPEVKWYDPADATSNAMHWYLSAQEWRAAARDSSVGFRLTITAVGARCAVVTELFAEFPEFRGKGLPDALIALAAEISGRRILSSTNSVQHAWLRGEFRTAEADKVWERLRAARRARYVRRIHRWLFHSTRRERAPRS